MGRSESCALVELGQYSLDICDGLPHPLRDLCRLEILAIVSVDDPTGGSIQLVAQFYDRSEERELLAAESALSHQLDIHPNAVTPKVGVRHFERLPETVTESPRQFACRLSEMCLGERIASEHHSWQERLLGLKELARLSAQMPHHQAPKKVAILKSFARKHLIEKFSAERIEPLVALVDGLALRLSRHSSHRRSVSRRGLVTHGGVS